MATEPKKTAASKPAAKKPAAKATAAKKPAAKAPASKRTASAKDAPKIDPASRAGRAQTRIMDAQASIKKAASERKGQAEELANRMRDEAKALSAQATERAREYSTTGKDKVALGLGGLAGFIGEAAKLVDDNFGREYGDYVRGASDKVSGAGNSLKQKNVDELVDEVAGLVKRNPAVTIGVVAAVGFALTRLLRGGNGGGDNYDDEA